MRLSLNKNGQLGRHLGYDGDNAVVALPAPVSRVGNLYLSSRQVAEDQQYFEAKEKEQKRKAAARAYLKNMSKQATVAYAEMMHNESLKTKHLNDYNRDNEVLKDYFTKQMGMSETEKQNGRMQSTADFSTLFVVPDNEMPEPGNPRTDFRRENIVGSPLTRDGSYGPSTDWDRFVKGNYFQNSEIHTGSTIARELPRAPQSYAHDTPVMQGMGSNDVRSRYYAQAKKNQMGDWWDELLNNTTEQIKEQLPTAIVQAGIQEIKNQTQPPQQTQQTIVRTVTQAPTSYTPSAIAASYGIPPMAVYGALGLLAVGVLFIGYKAVSK